MWTCESCGVTADLAPEDFPLRCGCGARYEKIASRGLGDTIAKITHSVGLATCGNCEKRRKKLNALFPWGE